MKKGKGKVYVGMSGGVDSSVSAALLKKQGYDVTGVFIKVWQPPFLACTWKDDRLDAMRVAAQLEIPFRTLDLEKEYKARVVDYMIREYKRGRTPNPDAMCNIHVKFGAFFRAAIEQGVEYVATGHYARVAKVKSKNGKGKSGSTGKSYYRLLEGVDRQKDQSYFLWGIGQRELSKTIFPVGGYQKEHVRILARRFGLSVAEKKDSQGLCFMGKLDMKDFLAHFIKKKGGRVFDTEGNIIGSHDGAHFFTIGQRHGFHIHPPFEIGVPRYVVSKNVRANTITVAPRQNNALSPAERSAAALSHTHWIRGAFPSRKIVYSARARYREERVPCRIIRVSGRVATISFRKPHLIAPGQSLVLYRGSECIGGGIIED